MGRFGLGRVEEAIMLSTGGTTSRKFFLDEEISKRPARREGNHWWMRLRWSVS